MMVGYESVSGASINFEDAFFSHNDLFTLLMSEWILPQETIRLDTALCQKKSRQCLRESAKRTIFNSPLIIPPHCALANVSRFVEKFSTMQSLTVQDAYRFVVMLKGIDQSANPFGKVKELDLAEGIEGYVNDEMLCSMAEGFPKLESLRVKASAFITGTPFLGGKFRHLKKLKMENRHTHKHAGVMLNADEVMWHVIGQYCPELETVVLNDYNRTATAAFLAASLPRLKELGMERCSVTNDTFCKITQLHGNLQKLSMFEARFSLPTFSLASIAHLANFVHLVELNMCGCNLTTQRFLAIIKHGSKLELLQLENNNDIKMTKIDLLWMRSNPSKAINMSWFVDLVTPGDFVSIFGDNNIKALKKAISAGGWIPVFY